MPVLLLFSSLPAHASPPPDKWTAWQGRVARQLVAQLEQELRSD